MAQTRSVTADNVGRNITDGVGRLCSHGGHDGDDDMLLDREWSGVERDTKDLYPRYDARPETEEREGDQLSYDLRCDTSRQPPIDLETVYATYTTDSDRGIAEEEELVEAGDEHGPADANEPCPESVNGNGGVIGICDGSSDFRVWGVVL